MWNRPWTLRGSNQGFRRSCEPSAPNMPSLPAPAPLVPIPTYLQRLSSDAQGSPVKKRGVGRWRLSVGGGGGDTDGDGFPGSPLLGNRNPFSPAVGGGSRGARLGRGGNGDEVCVCVLCQEVCHTFWIYHDPYHDHDLR